jgi:methylthioribose-1-phosphate isomerase
LISIVLSHAEAQRRKEDRKNMTNSTNQVYPVIWHNESVSLIDQTRLPNEYTFVEIRRSEDMARAIKTMIVRGAPAIGVAAAYGIYLGAREIETDNRDEFLAHLEKIAQLLRSTRPTAVNLFWAISRMMKTADTFIGTVEELKQILLQTAQIINAEDLQTCQAIGDNGLTALPPTPAKLTLLTHCNAGALATAGYGTALGVVRSAWREERLERVFADETRPRLQGAKLTTWECVQEGIPVTLITDNMAAHCMKQGLIHAVVVGADRIAANGDAANKIGTYSLAIVAKAHNIPFFVAAPLSTIDFELSDGSKIPIEERNPEEIYQIGETILTPAGVEFYNPAFDVTPAELITAIITENGVFAPSELVKSLVKQAVSTTSSVSQALI